MGGDILGGECESTFKLCLGLELGCGHQGDKRKMTMGFGFGFGAFLSFGFLSTPSTNLHRKVYPYDPILRQAR